MVFLVQNLLLACRSFGAASEFLAVNTRQPRPRCAVNANLGDDGETPDFASTLKQRQIRIRIFLFVASGTTSSLLSPFAKFFTTTSKISPANKMSDTGGASSSSSSLFERERRPLDRRTLHGRATTAEAAAASDKTLFIICLAVRSNSTRGGQSLAIIYSRRQQQH